MIIETCSACPLVAVNGEHPCKSIPGCERSSGAIAEQFLVFLREMRAHPNTAIPLQPQHSPCDNM